MGIREAILLVVVGGVSLAALVRPRVGLYGYVWYALMRPDLFAFVESVYPISLVLAVCTAIGAIREIGYVSVWFTNPLCRLLLLLQIPVGLSTIFAVYPILAVDRYNYYIRMIAVLLLVPVLIRTERDLRNLLIVSALSLGFVALKFGVFGVISGGADLAAAGYGDMLADNNFVALAFAMLIPLCWYCRWMTSWGVFQYAWLLIIASSIAGVIMSGSRGGSLAMALALLLIVVRTKNKLASLVLLASFAGGSIYLVQDAYISRMKTLETYHEDASAESRLVHAETALRMWSDHPMLGVGFGGLIYGSLVKQYSGQGDGGIETNHVAHNSYLQMLADSGIFAFLLYTGLLVYAIVWLGRSAARTRLEGPARQALPLAIQGPLLVFGLGSAFYSCQRMDLPYLFLMAAAAWREIERNRTLPDGDGAGDDVQSGLQEGELLLSTNEGT